MIDTLFNPIIQLVGFAAMIVGLLSYHPKHKKTILKSQLIANALWVIHFAGVGAFTGSALNLGSAVRAFVFNTKQAQKKKRSLGIFWAVIVLISVLSFISWQGPLSLLPFAGMLISTTAFWQRNPQYIRLLLLATGPFWFTYNCLSGSYAGAINEVFAFASISLAFVRHLPAVKQRVRAVVSARE
jgi:hypothetical protein